MASMRGTLKIPRKRTRTFCYLYEGKIVLPVCCRLRETWSLLLLSQEDKTVLVLFSVCENNQDVGSWHSSCSHLLVAMTWQWTARLLLHLRSPSQCTRYWPIYSHTRMRKIRLKALSLDAS